MIHILDYKSATFDFNPEIFLQYVDVPCIFHKFISKTNFIKNKLNKDSNIVYKEIKNNDKFTVETLSKYIDDNKDISIIVCNIDIFEDFYLHPNIFFNKISKKYPNIKFIVSSDETFFSYTKSEYNHPNVFYILNKISNPYSFVTNIDGIQNLTSYYIVNDYLQEDYVTFLKKMFFISTNLVRNKKYNFYNGVHKPHRLKSYELIKKHNLLEEGYFSYSDFAHFHKNNENIEEFTEFLGMSVDEYKKYVTQFEIPLYYDTMNSDPNTFSAFTNPPQTSFQSYVSITTETNFQSETSRDLTFSEKSFKPFYGFNIPLIVGQPTGLQYLKDLGFDLFEDFFDVTTVYSKKEIFNQFDKNLEKLKKISKLELHDFYTKNLDRVFKNFDLLTSRLKEKDLENLNNFLLNENAT